MNEIKEQIKQYIMLALSKGFSYAQVKQNLVSTGWSEQSLNNLFTARPQPKPIHPHTLLSIRNLSKSFKSNKVLDNISFDIQKGEIVGIIGVSGSGKTTLLNALVGFIEPEQGNVYLNNPKARTLFPISEMPMVIKTIVGFAAQKPSFYLKLTAAENLEHFGSLYGIKREVRHKNTQSLLKLTGLKNAEHRLATNLSEGMQKRLGIACSLVNNPHILILDEPTANLDPFMRKEMINIIKKINRSGTTVILTSHLLTELEDTCDRIAILDKGKIMEIGTPDQIKDIYTKNMEINIEIASGNYISLINAVQSQGFDIKDVTQKNNTLTLYTSQAEALLHYMIHFIETSKETLLDISVDRPSLAEVLESISKQ